MSPEQIRNQLHEMLPALKQRYPIEKMALFGSITRDDFTSKSDVDILIEFNDSIGWKFIDLAEEIEKAIERKVDLVSLGGLKKTYWRDHILKQAVYV